jgi:hypothetical protein
MAPFRVFKRYIMFTNRPSQLIAIDRQNDSQLGGWASSLPVAQSALVDTKGLIGTI